MLDVGPQLRLANISPMGTNNLPKHLEFRRQITEQQKQLASLHNKDIQVKKQSAKKINDIIKNTLQKHGIDRFGITNVDPRYTYNSTFNFKDQKAIVIVIPMDYDSMITAPSVSSATEILRSYNKGGEVVLALTQKLQVHGIQATGHHPMGDENEYHSLLFPPHAVSAGLGEKGRTGLFIDYKYGPLVRLGIVTVKAPLIPTHSDKRGITEFCLRCKYCIEYCPPSALQNGNYMDQFLSGEKIEFKIKRERCFKYFEKHRGCGRCIVNCILAEPDLDDIERRMRRIEKWYYKWIDSGELEKMYQRSIH